MQRWLANSWMPHDDIEHMQGQAGLCTSQEVDPGKVPAACTDTRLSMTRAGAAQAIVSCCCRRMQPEAE